MLQKLKSKTQARNSRTTSRSTIKKRNNTNETMKTLKTITEMVMDCNT